MDEYQFKQKILPMSRRLFGLCVKILGNEDEAQDAIQDVFVKLWTGREALSSIANIEGYATTITRNHCLDKLRLKKASVRIDDNEFYQITAKHIDDEDNETNSRIMLVNLALKKLDQIQQGVFVMRDIECKKFSEIAHEFGITEENVRVTLSRARKRIKEMVLRSTSKKALNW